MHVPLFSLISKSHAHLFVTVHQEDERCEGADTYHDIGIAVLRRERVPHTWSKAGQSYA